MALLNFPFPATNGQYYPLAPPAGTNVYRWSSADATWKLEGAATGVTAGTYGTPTSVPEITVDATGRILIANNLPIQLADTTQVGLVQLVDDTISNDPTKALTAAMGYRLANEIGDTSLLNPFYPNLVTAINVLGAPTGVAVGTYGNGTNVGQFTVNAQGRITSAVNVPLALATTTAPGVVRVGANLSVTGTGLLSVPNANTAQRGVVQLVDNTVTNDAGRALTAAAGRNLQLQIDALNIRNNLTFAGTISGVTGQMQQVTAEGVAAGFAPGVALPAPSFVNAEYLVVVTVAGTFTPTASPTVTVNAGDWLISDGFQWVYYSVGPVPPTPPGIVFLDDLSGQFNGTRVAFTLRVGGVAVSPGTNLLIFVGGVPQLAGALASYTLVGATITFTEAPRTGTTFAGVTVR